MCAPCMTMQRCGACVCVCTQALFTRALSSDPSQRPTAVSVCVCVCAQDLLTRALSNDPAQRPTAFELYAAVQDMRADLGTWQEAKHQADREELRKYEETRPPYVMSARVAALFQAWQRWLDEQAEGGKGDESAQAESSTRNTTPMSTPRPMNTPKALEHTTPVGTPRSDSDEPPQDAL